MDCENDMDLNQIRVLPDTCVELFLNYTNAPIATINNEVHHRSIVTFRMNSYADVQMRKGAGCLAICFYPGMAYRFFNFPMQELANKTLALSDLWNVKSAEIESQLADTFDHKERAFIVQKYLLQLLIHSKYDQQTAYCLAKITQSTNLLSVSQLTHAIGSSQRHLSRKFQQLVGLSPKEYLQMYRFAKSLQYLKKYPSYSLTEIAYKSEYYDQAHFNRDYKAFTGHTPKQVALAKHIVY